MNSNTKPTVAPGYYQHYKGPYYQVIDLAKHSESGDWLVIYRALYAEQGLWARPASMFMENVEIAGELIPRFQYLGTELPADLPKKTSELLR